MANWRIIKLSLIILLLAGCFGSILASDESGCVAAEGISSPVLPFEGFLVDGPYVFHKKNKIVVKSIKLINASYKIIEEEYERSQSVPPISCQMDSKSGPQFNIHLRLNHEPPPTYYEQPEKLFAISDIEGNFHALVASLQGNGIIDQQMNWIYGDGHLVLVGDFFDRGTNVTACLWLIYELENQAKQAGGMVHFINGNHEEMNFRGDTRYVRNKYKIVAKKMDMSYKSLYGEHSELGRWLRSKNVVEKIGKTIFVHGGISPKLAANNVRLEDMNNTARAFYGKDKWQVDQKGGLAHMVFNNEGPMWYRGYFSDELDQQTIDNICSKYGVERIIVGHTIVNEISTLFNSKVYAIDVKHVTMIDKKASNALLIANGEIVKVNTEGKKFAIGALATTNTNTTFRAIKENQTEAVEKFLEKGININDYYTNEKITMVHYAIKHDQIDVLRMLMDKGADPNRFYQDKTALMYAIKQGKSKIVRYLLSKGVDVNTKNYRKKTAIYYAAKYGDVNTIQLLLAKGADLHLKDYKGRTPLQYAIDNKNTAVVNYLLSLQ